MKDDNLLNDEIKLNILNSLREENKEKRLQALKGLTFSVLNVMNDAIEEVCKELFTSYNRSYDSLEDVYEMIRSSENYFKSTLLTKLYAFHILEIKKKQNNDKDRL